MPNHAHVYATFEGTPDTLADLMLTMNGEDSVFDFDKILPRPVEFKDVVSGHCTIDGVACTEWRDVKQPDGSRKAVAITPETLAEWRAKYGATNWYDWSCSNWGTKWNAYDLGDWEVNRKATLASIYFTTAWCDPKPVFEAIAKRFGVSVEVHVSGEVDRPYTYTIPAPKKKRSA